MSLLGEKLISQIIRNRISRNDALEKNFELLEYTIRNNIGLTESQIVKNVVDAWKSFSFIDLPDFIINGRNYSVWIEFYTYVTHLKIIKVYYEELGSELLDFGTEYGDIAILVDYFLEDELINRKISVLQSKKEASANQVTIDLHQLYLMHFWPDVVFSGEKFSFPDLRADEFSFYHFILNHSYDREICSTVCSAPYVSLNLNINRAQLVAMLKPWLLKKKTNPRTSPPSITLKMNLSPRTSNSAQTHTLTPKPFQRLLKECAYQFFGTNNKKIMELSRKRIPNILRLKAIAARNKSDWIEKDKEI